MADFSVSSTMGLANPSASWAPKPSPRRIPGDSARINTTGAVDLGEPSEVRDGRAHQRHERMWTPTEKAFHSSRAPETHRKMDDASMTYSDGVRTQTAHSMIETKLTHHPLRSQVTGTGKTIYQETFSPRGPIKSVGPVGRVASRQTPRSGYSGGQSWLFETHNQVKGVPAHLQSHNIL